MKVEPGTTPHHGPVCPEQVEVGQPAPLLPQLPEEGVPPVPVPEVEPDPTFAASIGDESDESPPHKKSAMEELLGDIYVTNVVLGPSLYQQVNAELLQYHAEPTIPLDSNPLAWWHQKFAKYPKLAKMAKCFLAIPGTSVPSERIFSTAGDIVTGQRAQLTPDNVNMLIFIKKNMKV